MTTTGTRSAHRASSGDGTTPSPISMPSTLPVSDCSRGKSRSASPLTYVISSDQPRSRMRADAVQDLVVVQEVHVLDVVLLGPALHADQADDVLAAPRQALGRAVGHVAELLDDPSDADPGAFANPVETVHHAGHGGGGHSGQPGDVDEREPALAPPSFWRR